MQLNYFDDDNREKRLYFASNGTRKVNVNIPKNAIVKKAVIQLEAQELPDASIIRVGVVKNCSLEDFNLIEERLEVTAWGKHTVQAGWGTTGATSFLTGESGKYRVIPLDPTDMLTAHPSYYRREFDLVFIPGGPLHTDLTNLLNSRIPIVTTNSMVARKLGLCERESLHGAITNIHIHDRTHYISEQFRHDNIRVGGRESEQAEHILIDAIAPMDENLKGILDTGTYSQSILVTSMDHKYAYLGISRTEQLLGEENLFTILRRTLEWCGIGGYITNIGMEIERETGGFKKAGRLSDIIDTPDFSESINKSIENSNPNSEGFYPIEITFHSDSPGILVVSNVRIDCVFLATITRFAEDRANVELKFDSMNEVQTAYVDIPKEAHIRSATLKIDGDLSNERISIISANEEDNFGVTASALYTVAQQIKTDSLIRVPRIALHLAKPEDDATLSVEIRSDYQDTPSLEILERTELKGDAIKKEYGWIDVPFDNLVLKPDSSYWIIVRTIKGKIHWHADQKAPLGGKCIFTKDDGKTWTEHEMDALFKIFYTMESYKDSPSLSMLPSKGQIWGYSGRFRDVTDVPDFSDSLADYIESHKRELKGTDVATVPLTFSALSIGTLTLFNLEIKCELPTLELKEEVETATIAKELRATLELLEQVKNRVEGLMKAIPEDILEKLEFDKV